MNCVFSIKMRASQDSQSVETGEKESRHISGAERIVREEELLSTAQVLIQRAMTHSLGEPDAIHLKIEKLEAESIPSVAALPVSSVQFNTPEEGRQELIRRLETLGIANAPRILELFAQTAPMRGAMLLDCQTLERLEPDPHRGVRATFMDYRDGNVYSPADCKKNHFREALALASKVVAHPNIVAEICVSDDPDYVTGYVASRAFGYCRVSPLKAWGDPHGGRIFLFQSRTTENRQRQIEDCIRYLQTQPVWIVSEASEVSNE